MTYAEKKAKLDALWTQNQQIRHWIAGERLSLALEHLVDVVTKANFNPNQPRVPRGSPEGGEWTDAGGGGGISRDGSERRPRSGSTFPQPVLIDNKPEDDPHRSTRPRIIRVSDSDTGRNPGGGASNPGANRVPDSPLNVWPVPGFGKLNPGNAATGEGIGWFGAPRNHGSGKHTGIDIQAPEGTPVVAAGDGKVIDLKPNPSRTYGNQVVIDHGSGVFTQSAHLGTITVKPGDTVRAGQTIGTVGRTGRVPPQARAHVHFEVRIGKPIPRLGGGTVRNPFDYLPPAPGS